MSQELAVRFEKDPAVIYALDERFHITYCNAAWDRFALANGGERWLRAKAIGIDLMPVIPDPVREFYRDAYTQALASGQTWEHDFECSSPSLKRRLHMRAQPIRDAGGKAGLVIINSVVQEAPHTGAAQTGNVSRLRDAQGFITMCCNCRRTQLPGRLTWVWVPQMAARLPKNVSHGLCRPCFELYYGR